jgi:hypothetical protein
MYNGNEEEINPDLDITNININDILQVYCENDKLYRTSILYFSRG